MVYLSMTRKLVLLVVCFLLFALPLAADVLFLVDGEILIGDFVSSSSQGLLYKTYKGDVVVFVNALVKSEKSIAALESLPVELILKDNSVIKGTIVDFDEDIGIFIDISFGTLTVPSSAVNKIVDPVQRKRYNGASFQYGVSGGLYYPLGPTAQYFGLSWLASLSLQAIVPGIRGLFWGADVTFNDTNFLQLASTKYYFVSVSPEVSYKLLDLRTKQGFINIFSPFASLGVGLAYINVSDEMLYPPSYGNLTLRSYAKIGTEIAITPLVSASVAGYVDILVQGVDPFFSAGLTLGVYINQ